MCKISTLPPGLILGGPLQAPISWLLFVIVMLMLIRRFSQTYSYEMSWPTSLSVQPAQRALLIATYALLLLSSLLLFLVATPSLQGLNTWFQSEVALLTAVCQLGTNQYSVLNGITAQASHAETYLGVLATGVMIVALICMGVYTRLRAAMVEGKRQSLSSADNLPFRNSIAALVLLIVTNVIYAISPALDGAGCGESCGFEVLFIRVIGSVVGTVALLVTLVALTRGLIALAKMRQWGWFVSILLVLVVCAGFFVQILLGPGRLDRPYQGVPDLSPLLTLPGTALVFSALTALPVALLLYILSRSQQNTGM